MAVMPCILIFLPGDESKIGLWQSHGSDASWCTLDVPRAVRGQSTATENRVLRAVDAMLSQAHISLAQVTHIGVMRGPASYTELRLFVTTANSLAWVNGLPLFACDPDTTLPDDIPHLVTMAKVNHQIEPVYPPLAGV